MSKKICFRAKLKSLLTLKCFQPAEFRWKKPLAMWGTIIFLCTAFVSCDSELKPCDSRSRQAGDRKQVHRQQCTRVCMHNYTCIYDLLMYLPKCESEQSLAPTVAIHTLMFLCRQNHDHVPKKQKPDTLRVSSDMHEHRHVHSLSSTNSQRCVKLRCAACDSINEWIALSTVSVCVCVCANVCIFWVLRN